MAGRLEVGSIVSLHAERIVAEGAFDGRPCFIKLFIAGDPAAQARQAETAIAFAHGYMAQGAFRVAPVLFTARLRGFIVLAPAPGFPLQTAIAEANAAGRAGLIGLAGKWLEAYCAPRRVVRRFSAGRFGAFHIPRMARPGWKGELRDSPLIRALGEHVAGLAVAAEGAPVSIASTHGDFVARNFHHDAGTICGFDLEGTRSLPVAWDIALFLVEIAQREGTAEGATWCGIRAVDAKAMAASDVIGAEEAARVLPIYIGHHLLRRSIRMGPGWPLDNVTEAATRFLNGDAS
ncbi:hypothetical protein GI374_16775 [Paracoccus sp. S-4012]|uniref:hypothetical protein n=1 Tax=Paracoccus sp. S-4012 TaxID=2665648 RepID=UPI0012B0AB70|nr:hypothetical protein [Paracoccus sp. S-4012]MRX52034.1 hypothetical protein [Paracoccus sp. S-4012]